VEIDPRNVLDSMKNGIKPQDSGLSRGGSPPPGRQSTLPAKALCSLNFNNLPAELWITCAET